MLLEKIKALGALILRVISASDAKCQEKDQIIADLTAKLEAAGGAVDEITAAITPNPTPAADEIVKAADESEIDNTPEVQDAVDNTVDTNEPTPEAAVASAVEMLTTVDEGAGEEE